MSDIEDRGCIEIRVREVTRYIVTKYTQGPTNENGHRKVAESTQIGEYDNADTAYDVGYAVAKVEHERLGYPLEDERIQYPQHPTSVTVPSHW